MLKGEQMLLSTEFILRHRKGNLPAPMKEPFAIIWFPWLFNVTPTFKSVPPKAVYMVAIWSTVAFRAARSDCKCRSVQNQAKGKKKCILVWSAVQILAKEQDNEYFLAMYLTELWEHARYQYKSLAYLQYSDPEFQITWLELSYKIFNSLYSVWHWYCRITSLSYIEMTISGNV